MSIAREALPGAKIPRGIFPKITDMQRLRLLQLHGVDPINYRQREAHNQQKNTRMYHFRDFDSKGHERKIARGFAAFGYVLL